MYIAAHEWSSPHVASPPVAQSDLSPAIPQGGLAHLYRQLATAQPDEAVRLQGAHFLRGQLAIVSRQPCSLPESPQDLAAWMEANAQNVTARYTLYLDERKAGAPRRFFSNRAHALYFLRSVAPTKLVDGAWLYGLVEHWRNPRFAELVQTYVEELGDGAVDKNHVVLYRKLLSRHGIDTMDGIADDFYRQGLIQLALGWNARDFLPEVIGFNLGYEQLPLHLLITAYELNELGLDPYYFTLHVTVDNGDTGHARRACQAVMDTLPQIGDADDFWERVRNGAKLGDEGVGTSQVIEGFDIQQEVVRILMQKSPAGHGAHSDYCRVAGRPINDWLSQPQNIPDFLAALEDAGWIVRGQPVDRSRFWGLLQGPRAEMFGVFSSYELQVIHDWIRGSASSDGQAYTELGAPTGTRRRATFRAASRLAQARGEGAAAGNDDDLLDTDLIALREQLPQLDDDARMKLLVRAMSPGMHWSPAGLHATRVFWERARC